MSYFSYLDLPKIPCELIESVDAIINKSPIVNSIVPASYQRTSEYVFFQTRHVEQNLKDYITSIFNRECRVQYQIVREGIPIHKDRLTRVAFNYIIQTGGEYASTNIYDDKKQLIQSVCIKPESWHQLKTDSFHNVSNLTTDRVAINVTMLDYVWGDKL